MKNNACKLSFGVIFLAIAVSCGCNRVDHKVVDPFQAESDATEVYIEDWKVFMQLAREKVIENEVLIAGLKTNLQLPRNRNYEKSMEKINELERQNKILLYRIDHFINRQDNWESFSVAFYRDIALLETELQNLIADINE
jgi:hypothetical protein